MSVAPDGRHLLAVAHGSGNDVAALRDALAAGVDLVEADVRQYRRTLEVRHTKTLGPHLLWDRWVLLRRRDVVLPDLAAVLDAADGDHRLMLDLKGAHRELAPAVAGLLRAVAPGTPVSVCARNWWMLAAFADNPAVRLNLSAGSRRGLRRLRALVRAAEPPWPGCRPPVGVCVRRALLTPLVVAELRNTVDHVLTWPVDTQAELADARSLGVTGVISRSLPLLREVLADC
ncbi:MAG: glycerophosphodiester phosphodiesterase [Jiangellaceae bacterium]